MATEHTEIRLYQNVVPEFIESTLEHLYENIFSALPFLKAFNEFPTPISTYVLEKDQAAQVVLLFRIEGKCVKVLNESMHVSAQEIEQFASCIFARFPDVELISLNAIRTDSGAISYPFQRFNCLEDIVINLPSTQQDYFGSLSKAMRKNIKRYLNKMQLDLPSLQHRILIGEEIEDVHVRTVIALNKARMQRKQKVSAYDALETKQIIKVAKQCGFVRIMQINGVTVAGEICTRVGNHYFSHLGAHDPLYDDYRLGILNCYLTICECIKRGGKQFHLLWGQYDYKYSLRGKQQDLDHVTLYRSRFHLLLNGRTAVNLGCKAAARTLKNSIYQKARESTRLGSFVRKTIGVIQRMKKLAPTNPQVPARIEQVATPPIRTQPHQIHLTAEEAFETNEVNAQKAARKEGSVEACID